MVEASSHTRVSVCMAAYNGEAFIENQIDSILAQLGPTDELVVIDDCSTDDTLQRVGRIGDSRIRLSKNDTNVGYVETFNRALSTSKGSYVLLSDQDDIWPEGRLEAMVSALNSSNVVAGNLQILGEEGRSTPSPLVAAQSDQHVRNIVMLLADRRGYWGCAMGVRREFLRAALPFPEPLFESHDLWLAMLGNLAGSITHLEQTVTLRRIHGQNATPEKRRSMRHKIRSRLMLVRCLGVGRRRISGCGDALAVQAIDDPHVRLDQSDSGRS